MNNTYHKCFHSWLQGATKILQTMKPKASLEVIEGKRYTKIVESGAGVFCFIDKTNGDVLKAASWSSPAKHARGNILDKHNGLQHIKWTGPEYLRG